MRGDTRRVGLPRGRHDGILMVQWVLVLGAGEEVGWLEPASRIGVPAAWGRVRGSLVLTYQGVAGCCVVTSCGD